MEPTHSVVLKLFELLVSQSEGNNTNQKGVMRTNHGNQSKDNNKNRLYKYLLKGRENLDKDGKLRLPRYRKDSMCGSVSGQ